MLQSAPVNSTTGNSINPLNSTISSGHTPLTPYVNEDLLLMEIRTNTL